MSYKPVAIITSSRPQWKEIRPSVDCGGEAGAWPPTYDSRLRPPITVDRMGSSACGKRTCPTPIGFGNQRVGVWPGQDGLVSLLKLGQLLFNGRQGCCAPHPRPERPRPARHRARARPCGPTYPGRKLGPSAAERRRVRQHGAQLRECTALLPLYGMSFCNS